MGRAWISGLCECATLWQTESKVRLLCAICVLSLSAGLGCQSEIGGMPGDGTTNDGDVDAGGSPDAAQMILDMPDAAPPCVEGDLRSVDPSSGACYWVSYTDKRDWNGAKTACEGAGGHLASLTSVGEAAIAHGLAAQAYAADATVPDYWIGATDVATEGTFVWSTGEPVGYTNWRDGEPNNGGIQGEDCAIIEGDTATQTWDDRECDSAINANVIYGYVCER